ncbi:MAG: hypothetical protein CSA20_01950 [Deltaproteobacteria bacterium]|nr:MAG: hypothetical protein CSA20_01950 [Deltaproteobacteria bacterium]
MAPSVHLTRHKNSRPPFKWRGLVYAAAVVAIVITAVLQYWPDTTHKAASSDETVNVVRPQQEKNQQAVSPPAVRAEKSTAQLSEKKQDAKKKVTLHLASRSWAEGNAPAEEERPSEEQHLHYQKTQMFIDEAKASLPLLDLRVFNALEAHTEGGEPVSRPNDLRINGRDGRGLRDGEVWVRINPDHSSDFEQVMAQTADLYRANLEYEGEVTVILWVGGQPRAKRTYGQAWQ